MYGDPGQGLGLTFAPTNQNLQEAQAGGGPGGSPVQQAIRVLSLRMPRSPRVVGAPGIAPQALLQAPGAAGIPTPPGMVPNLAAGMPSGAGGANPMLEFLRRLLSGGATPMQAGSFSAPLPHVGFALPPVPSAEAPMSQAPAPPLWQPPTGIGRGGPYEPQM